MLFVIFDVTWLWLLRVWPNSRHTCNSTYWAYRVKSMPEQWSLHIANPYVYINNIQKTATLLAHWKDRGRKGYILFSSCTRGISSKKKWKEILRSFMSGFLFNKPRHLFTFFSLRSVVILFRSRRGRIYTHSFRFQLPKGSDDIVDRNSSFNFPPSLFLCVWCRSKKIWAFGKTNNKLWDVSNDKYYI